LINQFRTELTDKHIVKKIKLKYYCGCKWHNKTFVKNSRIKNLQKNF
jgi:hypothetical protein